MTTPSQQEQRDANSGGCGICVCLFFMTLLGGLVNFMREFATDLSFQKHQKPALCIDGRRSVGNTSELQWKLIPDSRPGAGNDHKTYRTYSCVYTTYVHPCLDGGIDTGEWNGNCDVASETLPEARLTLVDLEWRCEYHACKKTKYNCAGRQCHGNAYAEHLCLGKIRAKYPCYYVEGDPSASVREEPSGFPVGSLLGSLACFLAITGCAALGFFIFVKDPDFAWSCQFIDICLLSLTASGLAGALGICFGIWGSYELGKDNEAWTFKEGPGGTGGVFEKTTAPRDDTVFMFMVASYIFGAFCCCSCALGFLTLWIIKLVRDQWKTTHAMDYNRRANQTVVPEKELEEGVVVVSGEVVPEKMLEGVTVVSGVAVIPGTPGARVDASSVTDTE